MDIDAADVIEAVAEFSDNEYHCECAGEREDVCIQAPRFNGEVLNSYNYRASNASAELFNAKIKLLRTKLRGVADKKFILFRIANLHAYPH